MYKIGISLLAILIASQATGLPAIDVPHESSELETHPRTTDKSEHDVHVTKVPTVEAIVINSQSLDVAVFHALTNKAKRAAGSEASTTTTTTPKPGFFPYGFQWNRF